MDWRETQAEDRGAASVEYGLLIFLIAAAITAFVRILGVDVFSLFEIVHDRWVAVSPP